jgi:S-formylglutathione hydrolase FrmB
MKNGVVKKAYSKILNKEVDIWVLCPQEPKALLYMMHGNGGDCLEWSENTDLVQQAQACGLAVVAPDFEDSYCTNTSDGRRWYDYLADEMPALAQEMLGRSFEPKDTYIAGISAGGYGLLKLAFDHPGRYAACASLSGVTDMAGRIALLPQRRLPAFRPIFGEELKIGPENDVAHLTRTAVEQGCTMPVWLACGTGDSFVEMNRSYDALLTRLGVEHEYHEGPGGHEWDFWQRWLAPALQWLLQH